MGPFSNLLLFIRGGWQLDHTTPPPLTNCRQTWDCQLEFFLHWRDIAPNQASVLRSQGMNKNDEASQQRQSLQFQCNERSARKERSYRSPVAIQPTGKCTMPSWVWITSDLWRWAATKGPWLFWCLVKSHPGGDQSFDRQLRSAFGTPLSTTDNRTKQTVMAARSSTAAYVSNVFWCCTNICERAFTLWLAQHTTLCAEKKRSVPGPFFAFVAICVKKHDRHDLIAIWISSSSSVLLQYLTASHGNWGLSNFPVTFLWKEIRCSSCHFVNNIIKSLHVVGCELFALHGGSDWLIVSFTSLI